MAKRKFYSPEFKAAILAEVDKKGNNNRLVGAKYAINANTISSWKSDARVRALMVGPAAPAPSRAGAGLSAEATLRTEAAVLRETLEVYKTAYRDLQRLMVDKTMVA